MSIPDQIRVLEELAHLDAELKVLNEKLIEERGLLDGLKKGLAQVQLRLAEERAGLMLAEKARNEAIGDVRSNAAQLESSRDKMNRARTERETNAVQREVEELKKLQRDREDEVERLGKSVEAIRASIAALDLDEQRIVSELSARESAIAASVADLETSHGSKAGGRHVLVKQLPPVLYRRYEAVRQRRGSAVSRTVTGTCTACHMALPPQMFHRLKREPMLEQCPSCNRIIYYASPVAP